MRKNSTSLTRRDLLRQSGALAAAPWFVSAAALGLDGATAASERVTLGVIGVGPRATYDLRGILPLAGVQCVAICDVQASRREAAKRLVDEHYHNRDCTAYRDFHELLGRRDIDAVLIATGDRWHAPASILAARAGKDIYSEKPCGLTIAWCQALDDTIRQTRRVFQAGTQRRSVPNFQAAVRLAHSGKLGRLQRLHASVYVPTVRNDWLPAEATPARRGRLGPVAGAGAVAAIQQAICGGRVAWLLGLRLGLPAPGLGRPHHRLVPVGQQGRRHHAGGIPAFGKHDHRGATPTGCNSSLTSSRRRSENGRAGYNRLGPARCGSWGTRAGLRSATAAGSRSTRHRSGRS